MWESGFHIQFNFSKNIILQEMRTLFVGIRRLGRIRIKKRVTININFDNNFMEMCQVI